MILREHHVSFQRTRTWKESTDPGKETKPDRIEHVTGHLLMRCFAFDQFGPLSIREARPDGEPIYVIMDNLSVNKTPAVPDLGGATRPSCA